MIIRRRFPKSILGFDRFYIIKNLEEIRNKQSYRSHILKRFKTLFKIFKFSSYISKTVVYIYAIHRLLIFYNLLLFSTSSLFELHQDLLAKDSNSTTALLMRLFDNYELDVAVAEHPTPEHIEEQHDFLRTVMNTRVMKLTMRYLVKKGKALSH